MLCEEYSSAYPAFSISVLYETSQWKPFILSLPFTIPNILQHLFSHPQCTLEDVRPLEMCILLSNAKKIQKMNNHYRKKNIPTNILSFPMHNRYGDTLHLGDIMLAYEVVKEESVYQQKKMSHHFYHLLVHGALHLIGFTHEEDSEAVIMENLEIILLNNFNISNPYLKDNEC